MISLPHGVRSYLACGFTDMRKGMACLAMLLQQGLGDDPFICVGREYVAAKPSVMTETHEVRSTPPHIIRRFRAIGGAHPWVGTALPGWPRCRPCPVHGASSRHLRQHSDASW